MSENKEAVVGNEEFESKKTALEKRKQELIEQKKRAIMVGNVSNPTGKSKLLTAFGVKSVDELLGTTKMTNVGREDGVKGVNTASNQYAHVSQEYKNAVLQLKAATDHAIIESKIFNKPVEDTQSYKTQLLPLIKAFGIGSGDQGFEWIPTGVSSSFIDEFNLERRVAGLFTEIRMPTNPFKFPVLSNGAVATKLGVATAKSPKDTFDTDSTITFDAIKMSNQYLLPEELSEDSAPAILQVIRQELVEGAEKAIEIAIINGDTAATHQDNDSIFGAGVPATDSSERFWDGLRKRALQAGAAATVDNGGGQLAGSSITEGRKAMGKYAVMPRDLALIVSPAAYFGLQDDADVTTLEKYGSAATVLTGELARIKGVPVIVSEWMREDLDATGVNSVGGPNDKTAALLVNRRRFYTGLRRGLQIRVERNQTDLDATDLVSFMRYTFQGVLLADGSNYADESTVAYIVNVDC